jgi:catechol 2,3-dioxygenase-like lactoylglutathione lyase family enzyme
MALELNHTIVPSHDKEGAAKFIAAILGLAYEGPYGHFAIVRVNDRLTLDFDAADRFEHHHYAFKVSDQEFDAIFDRVKTQRVTYGSGPVALSDMQINHRRGGRGFYFRDATDGHVWEVLTA